MVLAGAGVYAVPTAALAVEMVRLPVWAALATAASVVLVGVVLAGSHSQGQPARILALEAGNARLSRAVSGRGSRFRLDAESRARDSQRRDLRVMRRDSGRYQRWQRS